MARKTDEDLLREFYSSGSPAPLNELAARLKGVVEIVLKVCLPFKGLKNDDDLVLYYADNVWTKVFLSRRIGNPWPNGATSVITWLLQLAGEEMDRVARNKK